MRQLKQISIFLQTTLLLFTLSNCTQKSDDTKANQNLLLALIQTAEVQRLNQYEIPINGYWEIGFYIGTTYTKSGYLIISTNVDGTGTWSSTSSYGNGASRIVEIDKANRRLFYQEGLGSYDAKKFGRIDWTEVSSSGCEKSAPKCFYYCIAVFGKNTLNEAKNDPTVTNSTNPKASGCGAFGWSIALQLNTNTNWE